MNRYNPKKELRNLKHISAHRAFLGSLRSKLETYIEAHPASIPYKPVSKPDIVSVGFASMWAQHKLSFAAAVMVVVIIMGSGGMVALAKNSLPGDTLYPVKLFTEQVQLQTTSSPESQVQKNIEFAQRRVEEIAALTAQNKTDTSASIQTSVQEALQNLNTHLQQIADTIQTLKQAGEDQKSQQTEAQLQQAADSYATQLQTIGNDKHEFIKSEVEKSVRALNVFRNNSEEQEQDENKNNKKTKTELKEQESTQEQPGLEKENKNNAAESEHSLLKKEKPEDASTSPDAQVERGSDSHKQEKVENNEQGEQDDN